MTNAAIYCRVSTDTQAIKGYSLGEQNLICSQYIMEKGYTFVTHVHEDISGTTYERPEMDKLLKLARSRAIDVVVVQELDRFSRGLAPMVILEHQLKQHNVRVEYVLNQFEDSPTGDFMKTIAAGISELERQKILERMARGKNGKARAGKIVQSPNTPYGYDYVENAYSINEAEANVVRQIYQWYVKEQLGYVQIANRLTAEGVPTKSIHRKKASGIWNMSTIRNILSNRIYIGEYVWGKSQIIVPVPPITDLSVFEAAQAQKLRNSRFSRRNAKTAYLLTGMLFCKTCGERFYGLTKNKGSNVRYYRCGSQVPDHKPYPGWQSSCVKQYVKADAIEEVVWQAVKEVLLDPNKLFGELKRKQKEQVSEVEKHGERVTALQNQIDKVSKQEKRLLDLYLENSFATEVLQTKSEELKTIKAKLEAELAEVRASQAVPLLTDESVLQFETYCRKIRKGLNLFSIQQKRSTLKLLQIKVFLDKVTGEMEITGLIGELKSCYSNNVQSTHPVSFSLKARLLI